MRLYYAQNKEDLLIKSFFPDVKKGFYIDVGANDPIIDSVTKLFYDEDWSGINIDPIKKHIVDLNLQRPRDVNMNIGLSNETGELMFREFLQGDGLSTFDPTMRKYYEKGHHSFPTDKFTEYKVPVKTLGEIITSNKIDHVHFIKIDVEGFEYEVISGYNWQKIRPELICIEATHISKDWRPLLKKYKYMLVFFDGVNNYYLAEEAKGRESYFNYANATFAGNPIYYPTFLEIERQATLSAKQENKKLNVVLTDREHQIAFLHRQQRDIRFLAKRLNTEIQIRLNKRAHLYVSQRSLTYQPDPVINEALDSDKNTATEILRLVHQRDSKNIKITSKFISSYFRVSLWWLIAKVYGLVIKVTRKVATI
jgi:FkbM family methyltransferase